MFPGRLARMGLCVLGGLYKADKMARCQGQRFFIDMSDSLLASFGVTKDDDTPAFVFPTLTTTTGAGMVTVNGLTVSVPSKAFCAFIQIENSGALMAYGDGVTVNGVHNVAARLTATRLIVECEQYVSYNATYFILSLS